MKADIKLMSHTMKIWERIEARLRDNVEISKQQDGLCEERALPMPCLP